MPFYTYDRDGDTIHRVSPSRVRARFSRVDAGTQDHFIVDAPTGAMAIEAARRWIAVRGDDDAWEMPEDLALVEIECDDGRACA